MDHQSHACPHTIRLHAVWILLLPTLYPILNQSGSNDIMLSRLISCAWDRTWPRNNLTSLFLVPVGFVLFAEIDHSIWESMSSLPYDTIQRKTICLSSRLNQSLHTTRACDTLCCVPFSRSHSLHPIEDKCTCKRPFTQHPSVCYEQLMSYEKDLEAWRHTTLGYFSSICFWTVSQKQRGDNRDTIYFRLLRIIAWAWATGFKSIGWLIQLRILIQYYLCDFGYVLMLLWLMMCSFESRKEESVCVRIRVCMSCNSPCVKKISGMSAVLEMFGYVVLM